MPDLDLLHTSLADQCFCGVVRGRLQVRLRDTDSLSMFERALAHGPVCNEQAACPRWASLNYQ